MCCCACMSSQDNFRPAFVCEQEQCCRILSLFFPCISFFLPFCHLCAHLSPPPPCFSFRFVSFLFCSVLRSDSYFDYIMLALFSLCSVSPCANITMPLALLFIARCMCAYVCEYVCIRWHLLTYTSILLKLSKCHRRLCKSKSE